MKKMIIFLSFMLLIPTFAHAWDGYDYETGNYVK